MVTIVYASSEKFAPVLRVSLESLLKNKKDDTFYQVIVLIENTFSDEALLFFSDLSTKYKGFSLTWLTMGKQFSNTKVDAAGVGKESNYRLLIAELLPDIERCIYLDADTLVLEDLSEMNGLDISSFYLLGVRPRYFLDIVTQGYTKPHFDKFAEMIIKTVGEVKYDQYIGAGVMVMNLEKMRSDQMVKKFLDKVPVYSGPLDQDILNACCYGNIGELPVKYCIDLNDTSNTEWYKEKHSQIYADIQKARINPCIIHFSDKYKPWRYLGIEYETLWWKYAFDTKGVTALWQELVERNKTPATHYENEYRRIKNSLSYRIGKFITFVPKKIWTYIEKRGI